MARTTVIRRIRFFSAVVPVVMLVAAPVIALAFSRLGRMPAAIRENQIASLRYAEGLDSSLYKMELALARPDGAQMVLEQQRRFAALLDSAAQTAYTNDQRRNLDALAAAAKPIFDALRKADPAGQSINSGMLKLHLMVSNLRKADQSALIDLSARTRSRTHQFALLTLITALLLPWICFAVLIRISGDLSRGMREIRRRLKNLDGQSEASFRRELQAIDATVARLGFSGSNTVPVED